MPKIRGMYILVYEELKKEVFEEMIEIEKGKNNIQRLISL